ncbi:hypothetical protein IAR50_002507 [Cryptococcus sp. DSM 104548]
MSTDPPPQFPSVANPALYSYITDLGHCSDYDTSSTSGSDTSDSSSDSDGVPEAYKSLPLDTDSILLEHDIAKFFPGVCSPPLRPVWPENGSPAIQYYQPLAEFLNSVLDVAREAYGKSDRKVEYCALDTLFTEEFRWMVYDRPWVPLVSRSDEVFKATLLGCKVKDLSLFRDSTSELKHPHRISEEHLLTFAEVNKRNIKDAIVQASRYSQFIYDSQPNRKAVRSIIISISDDQVIAAIAELDLGGFHLTHFHDLTDDHEYHRFWLLLAAMYCAPIDDQGINRRHRFYSDEDGDMVLSNWSQSDKAWRYVRERLYERPGFFDHHTRVDALDVPGAKKGTKYRVARRGQSDHTISIEDENSGLVASSALFNYETIRQFRPPIMTDVNKKPSFGLEIAIARGAYHHLQYLLLADQALLGIWREDETQKVAADTKNDDGGTSYSPNSPLTLIDTYAAYGSFGLVKAILGALYGYRNLIQTGWVHGELSANNVVVSPTKNFKLYDYDKYIESLILIDYEIDCFIGDTDDNLCGTITVYRALDSGERADRATKDDLAFFTQTLDFIANQTNESEEDIPDARSTIFELESFFWILIYAPLYYHTQGGTSDTPDGHLYRSLFGSSSTSISERAAFMSQKEVSGDMLEEGRCLAPLKDLLTPVLTFVRHRQAWYLEGITKYGPYMCTWTTADEEKAVNEFIGIFKAFVKQHAGSGKQAE